MRIAVVGAGLTGLNAARILSEYCSVDVYERENTGGLAGSVFINSYWIEAFYHHFFRSDDYLITLLRDLNLYRRAVWKTVGVGQVCQNKIYSLSTPLDILLYPRMSLLEKLKLTGFTLSARRRDYRKFDEISVIDGLKRDAGEGLLKKFFLPLLKSKFGENYRDVSYAWLLARVSLRSNRKLKGEELGYLRGGFIQLVDSLSTELNIVKENARIGKSGSWEVNGRKYDAILFTAPLPELNDLLEKFEIPQIKYQSSICLLMGMKEPFHSSLYWINYENEPFGATIEHTNFMPLEDYGEHLIYAASYTTPERLYGMSDKEIQRVYTQSLTKYGLDEKNITWWRVFRAKYSGPVYEKGYIKRITPYRISSNFYIAGMTSEPNYPERSMNGSLKAGHEVANAIIKDHLS